MAGSVAIPVAAAASPEVVLAAGPAATQAVAVASRRCRAVVSPAVPILASLSCRSPPLESPPADIMAASARSWAEMLRCVSWNMVAGAVPWNRASRSFVQRTEVGHERHRHPAGSAGGVPGHAHRHSGTRQGTRLRSFRVHLGHRPTGQCCGCRRTGRAPRRTARDYLATGTAQDNFTERFSAEIQNGEGIVGYQYLYGTNRDAGDFEFEGTTNVRPRGDGTYEVTVDSGYTWNDRVDPNPQYSTDRWKSTLADATLGQADPYDMHITLHAPASSFWTRTAGSSAAPDIPTTSRGRSCA